jgi:hypothetical protein
VKKGFLRRLHEDKQTSMLDTQALLVVVQPSCVGAALVVLVQPPHLTPRATPYTPHPAPRILRPEQPSCVGATLIVQTS